MHIKIFEANPQDCLRSLTNPSLNVLLNNILLTIWTHMIVNENAP